MTISDTRSQGRRGDATRALIARRLERAGYAVGRTALIPDDIKQIETTLRIFADHEALPLVLTTGGTGLGPRDITPEATSHVVQREAHGISEALRSLTARRSPLAWLSRGIAGLRGRTLIINLPGSPRAVDEYLRALLPLLPHALAMVAGKPHEHPKQARGPGGRRRIRRGVRKSS